MNTKNPIYRSLDIIEKRINEKLTVGNIAADVYISKFHYMRLFRETVGDSVMDYINKRKLTLASKALIETDTSVIDIAMDFGYETRDGFTRSFKSFFGMTPAEYRKQSKNQIIQSFGKEYKNMKYAETINAVTQEINEWIILAEDIIKQLRRNSKINDKVFWDNVAEQTEILAGSFSAELEKVNSIAFKPDEIITGMDIVKAIDDTVFVANSIAFQIEMMEARAPEKNAEDSIAEKYRKLAWSGVEKAKKITAFLRELLLLVIEDMRKTASGKINDAAEKGKAAAKVIPDNCNYIKNEILQLVEIISSIPVEQITVQMLEDSFFKVKLITITAKLSADAANNSFFERMKTFSDALSDAVSFCDTVIKHAEDPEPGQKATKIMQDIVYMENILFFYLNGEVEYLNVKLNDSGSPALKKEFGKIKSEIDSYTKLAYYAERDEEDISVFQDLAIRLNDIVSGLIQFAKKTDIYGGSIIVIANELKRLADKTKQLVQELDKPECK